MQELINKINDLKYFYNEKYKYWTDKGKKRYAKDYIIRLEVLEQILVIIKNINGGK